MRLILGIAALVLVIVVALRERLPQSERSIAQTTERPSVGTSNPVEARGIVYVAPPAGSVLSVPPDQMRDVIRAHRRVRPDRRVLLAVADLHTMLTGIERRPVYATWAQNAWAIEYGEAHTPVGTLPELASLSDARALLTRWTMSVAKDRQLASAPPRDLAVASRMRRAIDSLTAPPIIDALAKIDDEWRRARDPRLLPPAADGLTMLAMFADDRTDMADALFARALAATVAARALTSNPPRRAEALLAHELGYGSEAHDSANALATDDALRLFLDRNDSALVRVAGDERADALARYLAIRRSAEVGKAAWDSAVVRFGRGWSFNTAGLESGFQRRQFDFQSEIPRLFAAVTFAELDRVAPSTRLRDRLVGRARRQLFGGLDPGFAGSLGTPKAVAELERRLAGAGKSFRGAFVDSSVIDGYYRSAYFAAVAAAATFSLDILSSVSSASKLATDMKGEQPDGPGLEFARWVQHLAESKAGQGSKLSFASDVASTRWLGQEQLEMSFEAFASGALFNQQIEVLDVAKAYSRRLDSRPKHLQALAGLAYRRTWDMPNAERLYRRLAELDRDDLTLAPWVARLLRDTTRLRQMLEDPTTPHVSRVEVARILGVDSLAPNAYVRAWFDRLIAARPGDWSTRDAYVEVLEKDKDGTTVERITKEWLEKSEDNARNSFEPVTARVALSRSLERQKRYADAWEAIEPALPSYVEAAMTQGVRVLGKLGRLSDAQALATEEADRYPDAPGPHVMVAEVLWRQQRYQDAARYLRDHAKWFNAWVWRGWIAESFLDVFGDAPEKEATAAMHQLAAANIPGWVLGQFGIGLRQRKRADLAFAMHTRGSEPTGAGGQQLPMQAFASLRQWRGEAEAVAWLRQYTRSVEGATAMILYQDDAFEALWSLDPPGRAYSTFTWLMRASAAATSPAIARRHGDELLAYYRRPIRDVYHLMGRHLVGLATDSELLALATTAERRCEIAYYIGLRARAEGRPYDAADWFAVAMETRQTRDGELIWAAQQLSEWANRGKTLGVLERDQRTASR